MTKGGWPEALCFFKIPLYFHFVIKALTKLTHRKLSVAPLLQDEARLIELIAQGSEYAFTKLYDHYRPLIYSVAFRMLKSRELSEEILQDVFVKVWIKREELSEIKHFRNYIFFMARNLVFDRLKKQSYETGPLPTAGTNAAVSDADNRLLHQEYQLLLDKAILQLTDQQAQVYRLAKIEGLSHEQIAGRLHIKRSTVKRHVADALCSIRQYLKTHPGLDLSGLVVLLYIIS